jgi:hypothetical protein
MMEKSSKIKLTEEDLVLFQLGQVPTGLKTQWGIERFSELKELIDSGQWELVEKK